MTRISNRPFWVIFYVVVVVLPAINGFLSGHFLDAEAIRATLWYIQKAGLFGLIAVGVWAFNVKFNVGGPERFYIAMLILGCVSLITGVSRENGLFYVMADFLGLIGPALTYWVLCSALRSDVRAPAIVVRTIVHFGIVMSLACIYNYVVFGGSKVMFPTQIGVALALAFAMVNKDKILALFGATYSQRFSMLFFIIVIAGVVTSNSRTSMAMVVLMIAIYVARYGLQFRLYRLVRISFLTAIAGAAIVASLGWQNVSSQIQNRIARTFVVSGDVIGDTSANQRFVEAALIWNEVNDPLSVLIGHGAGASYANNGYLTSYGDRVHNAHFSLAAVYLRTGAVGAIILTLAYILVFLRAWRFNAPNATLTYMYGLILLDCLTSQFIYWSLWLPLVSAMDTYVIRRFSASPISATENRAPLQAPVG